MSGYANISAFPTENELLAPQYLAISQQQQANANQLAPITLQRQQEALSYEQQADPIRIAQARQDIGWDANPAVDRLLSRYPTPGTAGPVTPFEQKLGGSEAPNAGTVNKGGYSGQFQFGAERLADLGVYQPSPGEDLSKNQWTGTFNIPPYNVKTQADFLASPAAQHAVFGLHVANIDQAIANTPGADKYDANGLRAVAHLGGVNGMQKFVATGGTYDPADANGTHLSDYYKKFADGGVPALQASFGSPHGPAGPPPAAAPGATPPELGTPGGGQPTAGMSDADWLAAASQSYPSLAGPNDTSQQPNAGAGTGSGVAARTGGVDVASNAPMAPASAPAAPAATPAGGQVTAIRTPDGSVVTAAPTAPNGLAPGAPGAPAPPPAARPATGMNSPQVIQAQQELAQAEQIAEAAALQPGNKALQAVAAAKVAALRQHAQLLMQTDSVSVDPNSGIQTHTLTGAQEGAAKGRSTWELRPNAGGPGIAGYVDTTGNEKPEIVPAQRADAEAQQLVMTLGPKVAAGPWSPSNPSGATPQEMASYGVALETYRHPVIVTDPITKQPTRVYERNAPNFGGSTGGGTTSGGQPSDAAQPLTQGVSPQQQDIERNPAQAKVADTRYDRDAKNIGDITSEVRTAQNDNIRVKEMQDILKNTSTGPGADTRAQIAAWFQRWAPASLSGWERESANLDGAAAAQAFQKLAFKGSISQEQGASPRGGYAVTKLFQQLNPGINLLNSANKNLLDMQLIANQANIDYNQGATDHFNTQEQRYNDTHKYDSLNVYDQKWNAQRNPQVYAAAMGAVAGQPVEKWAKDLSGDEKARAIDIVHRADPSANINMDGGVSMPKPPPGFKVIQ